MTARDIKRRLKAIAQTEEITEAMRLVASSRLEPAVRQFEGYKAFARQWSHLAAIMAGLPGQASTSGWPLRPGPGKFIIVFGADRGLAGAYHAELAAHAVGLAESVSGGTGPGDLAEIAVIGRKTGDYLRRRGFHIGRIWPGTGEGADSAAEDLIEKMLAADVPAWLVYHRFYSAARQKVRVLRLLPVEQDDNPPGNGWLVEPGDTEAARAVLHGYLRAMLGYAQRSSAASEQAARMVAMTSASENAREMMDELELERNRLRQGTITRELAEITGNLRV